MPYPGPFYRLQVSGTGPEPEVWSWGVSMQAFTTGGQPKHDTVPQGILDAVSAFHNGLLISSTAQMTMVKFNLVGTDGKYSSKTTTVFYEWATPIPGGGAPTTLPLQVTLAASLLTASKRGPGHRGRFFIPYPVIACNPHTPGLLDPASTSYVVGQVATLLDSLNAAAGPLQVVVASDVGPGAFIGVNGCAVGNRPDIIRSRGNQLPESYAAAAVNISGG